MKTNGWLYWVFCAVLLVVFAGASCAQVISPEELGFEYQLTLGAAFSVNADVDNKSSFTAGIAWYGPASEVFGENGAFGLSADVIVIKTNDDENVSLVPVMFNYKRYGNFGPYRIFAFVGGGVQVATDDIPEMRIDDGVNFGWTGGFGIDLTDQLFGQFKFFGGKYPGEDGMSSIQLGYRF
ncbi:MAG: hypothetical protein ABFD49_02435 [Armatimonadota bacterium]|nr:hypothetical protein [bacterium]